MKDWQSYWEQGGKYLETACSGFDRPEKFNPDALFNLAAMALEKSAMALLLKESSLPEGHTFGDLASGLEGVAPLPEDLKVGMARLDEYQAGFCSLEPVRKDPLTRDDIPPVLSICRHLREYVSTNLA